MDFYSQTNKLARKAHSHFTHDIIVHQYTFDADGGTNAYADGSWIESSSTVQGTIRQPELRDDESTPDGSDVPADVEIYISASDVAVSTGVADGTRATEFVDTDTGIRYKATDYHDEGSLIRIRCVEVDSQ